MTQAPEPSGGGNGLGGLLGRILAYVDRPWKAVVVVLLFIVGGVGWTLYQKRDEIIESWLTPEAATLKVAEIPAAMDKLIEESGADLVQIWAVDLSANSQRFLAARRSDGERPVIPSPRRLPVITSTSDIEDVVRVLAGHPACGDIADRAAPLMRRLEARGMKRACVVPIPPSPDAFVGAIYLTWREPAGQSAEDIAVAAAHEIAGKLASR